MANRRWLIVIDCEGGIPSSRSSGSRLWRWLNGILNCKKKRKTFRLFAFVSWAARAIRIGCWRCLDSKFEFQIRIENSIRNFQVLNESPDSSNNCFESTTNWCPNGIILIVMTITGLATEFRLSNKIRLPKRPPAHPITPSYAQANISVSRITNEPTGKMNND